MDDIDIHLEKNEDILTYVASEFTSSYVVGFAAETSDVKSNAKRKLKSKDLDMIISNDVSNKDIGFNSDYNEVTIHFKNRDVKKEKLSYKKKSGISDEIVDRIIDQLN